MYFFRRRKRRRRKRRRENIKNIKVNADMRHIHKFMNEVIHKNYHCGGDEWRQYAIMEIVWNSAHIMPSLQFQFTLLRICVWHQFFWSVNVFFLFLYFNKFSVHTTTNQMILMFYRKWKYVENFSLYIHNCRVCDDHIIKSHVKFSFWQLFCNFHLH